MTQILIPSRRIWTRQPTGPLSLAHAGRITPPIAVAVPRPGGAIAVSERFFVEPFAKLSASGLKIISDANGLATDGTALTTASCRLHSVARTSSVAQRHAWDRPSAQITFAAVCLRRGTNSIGVSQIFTNGSASVAPYAAYSISLSTTNELTISCAAGGTSRVLGLGTLNANTLSVIVGRYDGSKLEGFVNGIKDAASTAGDGNLVYPASGASPGGPAIGNFYQYTTGTRSFAGSVFLAALWDTALSDREIEAFAENPWQLFGPRKRVTVVDFGSSGELSITATVGAADAYAFDANVDLHRSISASLGAAVAIGYDAMVELAGSFNIPASLGVAEATGKQALVNLVYSLNASQGVATAIGFDASISNEEAPFTQAQLDYLLAYMQEHLMIPTAEEIAAAVLAAMQASPPPVNVKKVNDVTITGSGVSGDSMRPA